MIVTMENVYSLNNSGFRPTIQLQELRCCSSNSGSSKIANHRRIRVCLLFIR